VIISREMLLRRGWIVPLCVILVVAATVIVNGSRSSYYRTAAVLVVPADGGSGSSSYAPAATLATTYAELIGQDQNVIDAAARIVGLPPSTVKDLITATQSPGTSIIDVTFADDDPKASAAGDAAVVDAVTGPHPLAVSIPAGALKVVSSPGVPTKSGGKLPGGPVPIGIVLGLILGIAALIAWDRQDARVENERTLEDEIGLPVTTLGASNGSIQAVQQRWFQMCDGPSGATVALVRAAGESDLAARTAHESLLTGGPPPGGMLYRPAGAPGLSEDGDMTAITADLVVLVTGRGDRMRDVRRTIGSLRKVGVEPRWAILTDATK
jgi:capsular polysaccharide biosynthesis protein